jgi:lipoprotein-anchoring transpeptidase ErfK/SrfK
MQAANAPRRRASRRWPPGVGSSLVLALAVLAAGLGLGPVPAEAQAPRHPAPVVTAAGSAPALGAPGSVASPVVAAAPTPSGGGYWLVARDGGIFAYGDARFFGSTGAIRLNQPIVGMAPTPSGGGYWLVASDGGTFAYGDAAFHGAPALPAGDRAVAVAGHQGGYWVATAAGRVHRFGPAPALNVPTPSATPVVGFAARPDGTGAWLVSQAVPPPPPVVAPAPSPGSSVEAAPAGSGSGRRIVYDNTRNRVWLVRADNTVERTYLVSGRRNTPATGTYRVFSKSPLAYAGHDGITMRHMVRFTHGVNLAIGFHSIPTYRDGRPLQSEAELGQFRSSGCIRQRNSDAEYLYNWAPVGTTVVVIR